MSVQSSAVTKRKTKELGFWQKVWRQRQLVVLSLPVLMVIIFVCIGIMNHFADKDSEEGIITL